MIKGGCLCGKIRYEFKQEDVISAGNCHCKDCQKATGSGKATIVYIPSESLKINDDYKIYSVIGYEGSNVNRGFCPNCGSPIISYVSEQPDIKFIKASAKITEAESLSASTEALAKPKSNRTTHQYEPLPEGYRAPEVCWFINGAYCEARGPASNTWQPDWEAAQAGRTIGRLGDTDGWGNPVLWNDASRDILAAGEVFETPAGNYQVVTNKWGDLVLRPLDDAWRSAGENFRSMTAAGHHIGVHPKTGEVWYQAQV